jgi:hypothetical protein
MASENSERDAESDMSANGRQRHLRLFIGRKKKSRLVSDFDERSEVR